MGRKRNKTAALLAQFDEARLPIYALDRQQQIIYANEACCQWLGLSSADVIGQSCVYAALPDRDSPAGGLPLAPPPDVWQTDQPAVVPLTLGSAPAVTYQVYFHQLATEGTSAALLAVAAPAIANAADDTVGPTAAALHDRLLRLRAELAEQYQLHQLLGDVPAMAMVREQVGLAGGCEANVLIVGEAGSGRRRLARAIHHAQAPPNASLAPIACPITDAEMLQMAIKAFLRRREELGESHPGTLLLLDVDQLSSGAQHELAGFLSLPGFQARLIGTAARPLTELAAEDSFDPQLAYQLSTLVIALPSLRQRRGDIPLLAQHFLEQVNLDRTDQADSARAHSGFSARALELLQQYDWPRNLPQLAAAVQHACQQASAAVVTAESLPAYLAHAAEAGKHPQRRAEPIQLDAFLENIELELIQQALAYTGNNKTKAAELLGISRARMIRRVQQLGLEPGIDFEEI